LSVPVDLVETKVSYGLSKDGTQLQFFCDVTLGGQVVPETVGLEVEWLADDEVIQSETFGLLQQHKGVLKEEKWSIGQTVSLEIILNEIIRLTKLCNNEIVLKHSALITENI